MLPKSIVSYASTLLSDPNVVQPHQHYCDNDKMAQLIISSSAYVHWLRTGIRYVVEPATLSSSYCYKMKRKPKF